MTKAKGGVNNLWTQNYSYDRYGNRTNVTATGVAADNTTIPRDGIPNLTYNNATNRITTAGFEYDVAGNQTRALSEDGVTWLRYDYDAANRLQGVKRDDGTILQAFQFGSTNARLMSLDYQTNQLTMFASVGGTNVAEYTQFTLYVLTWTKSYIYLGESQLSTLTPNGTGGETTEYNHPDRLGTRVITNQALGTSYEQTTLPFGTALNAESTTSQSKRFTSYERSAQTGLDYAVNRTYDSKQGRFTQVDPIGMKAVDLNMPQTLNLYNYCGNDPINHTDPDGLSWLSKLFRFIKKNGNFIMNIVKIAVFVAMVFVLAATFGVVLGIIIAVALMVATHIIGIVAITIYRIVKASIQEDGLSFGSFFRGLWRGIKQAFSFVKAIFTGIFKNFLVTVYGYFCAPGWGREGPTRNLEPINELDAACKEHDFRLKEIDDLFESGQISKKERKRLRTKSDLRLMKKAFLSGNRATGGFLVFLEIAFLVRVLLR